MSAKMKSLAIAIFLIMAMVLVFPAGATLQVAVTVYDTVNTATGSSQVIMDGGANDADGIVNNVVQLPNNFQPIPNFIVQGSYHTSKLGGLSQLTSGSSTVTNNRATPARSYVAVSDTDFVPPANVAQVTGSGTFTSAEGSEIHLKYYDDPANEQGADYSFADYADFVANAFRLTPGDEIAHYDYTAADDYDSFSFNQDDIAVSDMSAYSMTLHFDFTLTPGGMLTSRGQSMVKTYEGVPEFPTLALPVAMIVGLFGVVLFIKRDE